MPVIFALQNSNVGIGSGESKFSSLAVFKFENMSFRKAPMRPRSPNFLSDSTLENLFDPEASLSASRGFATASEPRESPRSGARRKTRSNDHQLDAAQKKPGLLADCVFAGSSQRTKGDEGPPPNYQREGRCCMEI